MPSIKAGLFVTLLVRPCLTDKWFPSCVSNLLKELEKGKDQGSMTLGVDVANGILKFPCTVIVDRQVENQVPRDCSVST